MAKYRIPIPSLTNIINPLDGATWGVAPISVDEINTAILDGNTCDKSWQELQAAGLAPELHRLYHVMRIAHLVTIDPNETVEHSVFLCVSKDRSWFYDGNHRAAAAIARGDPHIDLKIANSGEIDLAQRFPGIVDLDAEDPAH